MPPPLVMGAASTSSSTIACHDETEGEGQCLSVAGLNQDLLRQLTPMHTINIIPIVPM